MGTLELRAALARHLKAHHRAGSSSVDDLHDYAEQLPAPVSSYLGGDNQQVSA
jgi:hypothetical protein